jgi:hypothetical protein
MFLLPALTLASACASARPDPDRVREVTEVREVGHFARVVVQGPVEVTLEVGVPSSVSVRADEKAVGKLVTTVAAGTLDIRLGESGAGSAAVRVGLPHLGSITCGGGASARIAGLQGGQIEIELEGNGGVGASGTVQRLVARVDGPGRLDLRGLATRDADVRVRGSGTAEVTVSGALDALVEGAGGVVYHGNPIVWSRTSPEGSVSRR